MKHRFKQANLPAPLRIWLILIGTVISVQAQNTVLTYQGQVQDSGTNFTGIGQFEFALVTSSNANFTATATATNPVSGFITTIIVTSGGSGYTSVPVVTITGGGGSGAAATATISNGVVTAININPGGNGSGYTSVPTVIIAPPPAQYIYTTYWSNDGTSSAGSEPTASVAVGVTNGLFTVVLGNPTMPNMTALSSSLFTQLNLQLLIWFSDGVHGFAALLPAQNLTPVPYATFAGSASNLLGSLPATQLTGTVASSALPTNAIFPGVVTAASFAGSGTNLTSLNAGSLSGGTVPLAQLSGITSNQLDATSWQLATNLNGGLAALATNVISGIGITNAFITNSTVSGNGSGLTSLNAAQLISIGNTNAPAAGNFFVGGAGNSTMSGYNNTAIGLHALAANTNGLDNTAIGLNTLIANTGGSDNTASGAYALQANLTGHNNTAAGFNALTANLTGIYNTVVGANALSTMTNGANNTAYGTSALENIPNSTGNTAIGYNALSAITGGSNNIAVGFQAGSAIIVGSSNIDIGAAGFSSDANVVRIGASQTATYLPGTVYANNVALTSDRNAKEKFALVNAGTLLAKVTAMPVTEWQYKATGGGGRHIGPMAQDFHAAFGLNGPDNTHISAVDLGGVALAAIQGLNEKLETKCKESEAATQRLEAENAKLTQDVADLRLLVEQLSKRQSN
jgi:hypothetical protein